ncbi:MAG: hypothetical protein PHG30_02390, partial [Eubacteriales bacterium]|nr:hypothetical protein [Eubacteriales bacterium]
MAREALASERLHFITQDEINAELCRGGQTAGGKYRIYRYFKDNPNFKERADFLKHEYGTGGRGDGVYDTWNDAKGFSIRKYSVAEPDGKILLTWAKAARRVDELIRAGHYLTPDELEKLEYATSEEQTTEPKKEESAIAPESETLHSDTLAGRLCDFYKDLDFYDYRDSQEIGETDEDVIARLEQQISDPATRSLIVNELRGILAEESDDDIRRQADSLITELVGQADVSYALSLGTAIWIGRDEYEILSLSDDKVTLYDPSFPLFNKELPRDVFESRLRENPQNDHLIVKDTQTATGKAAEDVFNEYSALFVSKVLFDEAYINACKFSDAENAQIECEDAVERVFNTFDPLEHTALYRAFTETPGFAQRVKEHVFRKTYTELIDSTQEPRPSAEPAPPPLAELTVEDYDAYNALKEHDPDALVAFRAGDYYELYGEDAADAGNILHSNMLQREISGIGTVKLTGFLADEWVSNSHRLWRAGRNVVLYEPDGNGGHSVVKRLNAVDYIPIGTRLTIDERRFIVESVDFTADKVSLRDVTFEGSTGFPIFRSENIEFVRSFYEEQPPQEPSLAEVLQDAEVTVDGDTVTIEKPGTGEDAKHYTELDVTVPDKVPQANTVAHQNYRAFTKLAPQILSGESTYLRFTAGEGFMPLSIDRLGDDRVAISHTYTQNGDLMADPDMEFVIDRKAKTLSARSFQQDGTGTYQCVSDENDMDEADKSLVKSLNSFARTWFEHIQSQGYRLRRETVYDRVSDESVEITYNADGSVASADGSEDAVQRVLDARGLPTPQPEELRPSWKAHPVSATRSPTNDGDRINFHITDDELGYGGPKTKYGFNIAAIRTLQQIEAENRLATTEEQEVLSRYVGWGGIPDAFDESKSEWAKEYAELKGLLSDDEYRSARESVLNAHYTSPVVIKAIYSALEGMGFRTGNILEPGCGVGNFFGLVPGSMANSRLYGIEIDSITGRITRQLYQRADIRVQGFETADLPDSFFDVAVGNVPFGQYSL